MPAAAPAETVIRFARDRVAPGACTIMLAGLARSGLLGRVQRRLPPATYQALLRLGNWGRLFTPGRRYLELGLMPALMPARGGRVVLVGIRPYTAHYSWFYLEQEVLAIDPDPAMARYRGRARFAAIRLRDLLAAVEPGSIDLIHCNGVYGWGLDDQKELEESFDRAAEALAPGGLLLLGYNLRHNNPLGWSATTALPQARLVELHAAGYPACVANNQVFRLFTIP